MKTQDLQRKEQMDMEVVRSPPGGKYLMEKDSNILTL